MSGDSKRRRGRPALHQNGGSLLVRAPSKPGDEIVGGWTHEQLVRMDELLRRRRRARDRRR